MSVEMIAWNFAAAWAGVGIALISYFYFIVSYGDVDFKRKWFPCFTLALNLFVIGVASWTLSGLGMYYSLFTIPFVALAGYITYKTTKFCEGCGSAAPAYISFRNVRCCPRCKKQFAVSDV